jgi:membrane protein DedA with SNARE-associated domain
VLDNPEQLIADFGYLGVFLGIVSTGLGFPLPEELPIILGGILSSTHPESIKWYIMWPLCIVAVVIGDGALYGIGRLWGQRLLETRWMQRLLSRERRRRVEENFDKYGVKILLFARLLPGIRSPIFITAGIMRVPLPRFVLADAIYAIPGVSLLFWLAYYFTDQFKEAVERAEANLKPILILVGLGLVVAYLLYHFLRHPVTTGDPKELPHLVEEVTTKIMRTQHAPETHCPGQPQVKPTQAADGQPTSAQPQDAVQRDPRSV